MCVVKKIVNVYNTERYIAKTLLGFIKQGFSRKNMA